MLEVAVAEAIAVLGRIGYDVWKRWLEQKGSAVVNNGSASYSPDPSTVRSMNFDQVPVGAEALLTVHFHPEDELAAQYIFQEQPCLLVIANDDHPEVDSFVITGRIADIHEILLPPGFFNVSAFVFEDETLMTLGGVGWQDHIVLGPGSDVELSLAIGLVADEITEALLHDDFGTIHFDTGDIFPLVGSLVTLGRAEFNDIVVNDPRVSNQHLVLRLTHRGWAIEDRESLNGTYVNSRRIEGAYLDEGDVVTIGSTRFVVS